MNSHFRDILYNRFFLFSLFFLIAVIVGKLLSYETVEAACLAALGLLLLDFQKPLPHEECCTKAKLENPVSRSLVMIKPRIYDENFMQHVDNRIDELEMVTSEESVIADKNAIIIRDPQITQEIIRLPEPLPKKPVPNLNIQIVTK
ncbi:MAG: hypothetical protein ACM3UZ_16215 [Acidobacteriota bacterium]